jgi:hypothetical protein
MVNFEKIEKYLEGLKDYLFKQKKCKKLLVIVIFVTSLI